MALKLREATFAVVDVETTGVNPAVDRVVEVACALVRDGREVEAFSTLIDPGCVIPAVASAVHHITNEHVRGSPLLDDFRATLTQMCAGAVVVAHNARFDLGFLPFLTHRPTLCSMRLAMRVLPDAPNYKNQVLRYHLDVDAALGSEAIAHRARGDVQVTGRILTICLERYLAAGGVDDVDHLVREVAAPRLLPALTFGRHRGIAIEGVPADYLRWLYRESLSASRDARYTAQRELERRAIAS
jgi:DNA polymerase III alpha subunit (gram-positive type)